MTAFPGGAMASAALLGPEHQGVPLMSPTVAPGHIRKRIVVCSRSSFLI